VLNSFRLSFTKQNGKRKCSFKIGHAALVLCAPRIGLIGLVSLITGHVITYNVLVKRFYVMPNSTHVPTFKKPLTIKFFFNYWGKLCMRLIVPVCSMVLEIKLNWTYFLLTKDN
jgi:hypothetical protein